MEPRQGLVVAEKYRLERLLAQGGMGSVWVGIHEKLESRVAVKFMSPSLAASPDMHARFEREAKAAAHLRSPHVVQVLDYGVESGTPYIVMELLEGEDLRVRLKRKVRLSLQEAAVILTQACKALRLAGGAGLVHRDLKPGNIFLARSGDDEVVKILDFGVAKAMQSEVDDHTAAGIVLGSPHYMSPEQARGMPLDHRSDLFSMAVMLFQMIVGRRPFQGRDAGDVIVRICSDPLPRPSELVPGLPVELDDFFARALARDPKERFQSARTMADAFAAIVSEHVGEELERVSMSSGPRSAADASWPNSLADMTPLSFPSSVIPPGSLRLPIDRAASPGSLPGTLTLATGSVEAGSSRASRPMIVFAALVVGCVAGVVWWELRPPAEETAAPAAAPSAPEAPPAMSDEEPADEPAMSAPTAAPTPTTSATVSATPSASSTAPRARRGRSKPASPPPAPSVTKHPVLGI